MAGGVTTSELVAAVSNAGGLGMIGAGYMTPQQTREQIRELKQLTVKSFGINLFVPNDFHHCEKEVKTAQALLKPFYKELGLEEKVFSLPTKEKTVATFKEQLQLIIEEQVPICSFTFGLPTVEQIKELKKNKITLIGTATTIEEAERNEAAGMDMVVMQGTEAGGHRGTFSHEAKDGYIGLMSLIPQAVDSVNIPVIAAGGIMDGRGVSAALCLGAYAVQMGTAFLTCVESGANQVHKEAILQASADDVVLTRAFSGKWARGIDNRFIAEMKGNEEQLPGFPIQNTLTKALRGAASSQGIPDFMSLWSGQSPMLAKMQTVHELIETICNETKIKLNIS